MKSVSFRGTSLVDLRQFPDSAKREAGYQIDKVQNGEEPDNWKPMKTIGPGVNEIRIADEGDAYRVLYVAKFEDTVYILHCFKKQTQKTSEADKKIAVKRYKSLLRELQK